MIIKRIKTLLDYIQSARRVDEIVKECVGSYIMQQEIHKGLTRDMCYVGLTNDVERRDKEHNAKSFWTYKCESSDQAKAVEEALANEGFDAGKQVGHGQDDSLWVYAYIKTEDTKEKTDRSEGKDKCKPYYTDNIQY